MSSSLWSSIGVTWTWFLFDLGEALRLWKLVKSCPLLPLDWTGQDKLKQQQQKTKLRQPNPGSAGRSQLGNDPSPIYAQVKAFPSFKVLGYLESCQYVCKSVCK